MICKLVEVALILCLDYTIGVTEVECAKKSETVICVEPNYLGDCQLDSADDFMHGNRFNEIEMVIWMNLSCSETKLNYELYHSLF